MIGIARIEIVEVPSDQRSSLLWILDESFEGWYLRHSRRTLREIELVRAARLSGQHVGLTMLKTLEEGAGYVFYIAVARAHRKHGIAKILLEDALEHFRASQLPEVFASVEEDNEPSERLFASEGFERTSFGEVSKMHGHLHALNMYRTMWVVPGEVLLRKAIKQ
jgi:ribosomal protein S18 acetylase RimI-like enzyme